MTRVAIIEDDKEINQLLSSFLKENGYDTVSYFDGKAASEGLKTESFQLVLMDLMLPYKGGDCLIKELREYSDVPVIVLSAKSMMETKLEVLRLGADDYVMKPFDLNEVLVRMEVVLRRSGKKTGENGGSDKNLQYGLLKLLDDKHQILFGEKEISLTSKEYELLKVFLENPQKTFTKANLYESVWGDVYYYEDNIINVHMSNLRNKLKKATGVDYIQTVWGIGYRLNEQAGDMHE